MSTNKKIQLLKTRTIPIHFFRKIPFKCSHINKIEFIVIGYTDGLVIILDELGVQYHIKCEDAISGISFACCSLNHKIAASMTALDNLYIYDNITIAKEPVIIFSDHEGRALDVAWFSENDKSVVVTSDERGNIYRYCGDILKNKITINKNKIHRKAVLRIIPFNFNNEPVFLTFSDDRNVLIHKAFSNEIIQKYDQNNGWIEKVFLMDSNHKINTICISDRVGILFWDMYNQRFLFRYPYFTTTNFSYLNFDKKLEYVSVGSLDKYLLLKKCGDKFESIEYSINKDIRAISLFKEHNSDSMFPSLLVAAENKIFIHNKMKLLNNMLQINESAITEFEAPILSWIESKNRNEFIILLEDFSIYRFTHCF